MAERDRLERSVDLPASPPKVWDALTDAGMLSEWFGGEVVELDARPGGRFALRTEDGRLRRALVETVEQPRLLVFRWLPIEQLPDGAVEPIPHTAVTIRLDEMPDGTRLTVTEDILVRA